MNGGYPGRYPVPCHRGCRRQRVGRTDWISRAAERRPTKEEPSDSFIQLPPPLLLAPSRPKKIARSLQQRRSSLIVLVLLLLRPNPGLSPSRGSFSLPSLPLVLIADFFLFTFPPACLCLHLPTHTRWLLINRSPASHTHPPPGPDVEAAFPMANYVFQRCTVFLFGLV
ncbi:hypothetical protein BO70DRAFT_40412 [Aspergillus heteromorphus CBS 117.55]|uniref:Uncharacterized protein n=1 Tax=Aspergillus heteromorphus CBS 117.55 TaxID=1448321 RepID=A0A317WA13_9EURO|nr:uncharacterized protein BO70DRAFT_40412 [Aspergillus heteromorphus CBS 117.55]PWY81828.1 hypothetical protein BO70DRAFT_40412 [Aspergillus heteromorphus CBS 117.55]